MNIIEPDFKLIWDEQNYVLYLLKSKKEIKEDSTSDFKVGGYYTSIFSALKDIYHYRKHKKYPGKESYESLGNLILKYKRAKENLNEIAEIIYLPILNLKKEIIRYE